MSIYEDLLKAVEDLPKDAIERTKKDVTRKGYDTTGYQYQFLVNVMNEIFGIENWYFDYALAKEIEGKYNNGKPWWDLTVNVTVTVNINDKAVMRKCAGGHRSEMYADALKGAITNGYKKTVALFGVGKKAYEGTIDEDYRPIPGENAQEGTKTVKFPQNGTKPRIAPEKPTDAKEMASVFKISGKPVSRDAFIEKMDEVAKKHKLDLGNVITFARIDKDFPDMDDSEVLKTGAKLKELIARMPKKK